MGDNAKQVLTSRDQEQAARLREQDDAMDELYRQLFSVLLDQNWTDNIPTAVDAALLGRFYERFADHAVEIGRRVVFMASGDLPEQDEISTY